MTLEAMPIVKSKVEVKGIDYPEVVESRIALSQNLGLVCRRLSELEDARQEKVLTLISLSESESKSFEEQAHIDMLRQELAAQCMQLANLSQVRLQIISDLIVNTRDMHARDIDQSKYAHLLHDPRNVNPDLFGEDADI